MKHLISVLTGSLFACASFVYAEESVSENTSESTNLEQQASAPQANTDTEILKELNIPETATNTEIPVTTTTSTETPVTTNTAPSAATDSAETPVQNLETAGTQAVNESTSDASATMPSEQSAPAATTQAKTQKKVSIWDRILNMFKVSEPKARTCEEAFNQMEGISVDFSRTTDFAENGDKYMELYYQKIKQTNSFGTRSSNLYINLSSLNVNSDVLVTFIGKWSKVFSEDKKTVLWNLSDNKSLGDNVIDNIDLSNIYSLNLSNTSISDLTINKIISILNIQNTGKLVCVNVSGTKVSDAVVESLKAAFQKAKTEFEARNPGKTYSLEGDNNSGVIFNKLPAFLKQKQKAPNLTDKPNATPVSVENIAEGNPSVDSSVPESNVVEEGAIDKSTSDAVSLPANTTADTVSTSAVTEEQPVSTTGPSNEQINDVLSEADKLIADVEQKTPEANISSADSTVTTESTTESGASADVSTDSSAVETSTETAVA